MRGSAPARGINCRPASRTAPHCRSLSPSRAWRRYCCRLPQRRNRREKFRHCLASNRSRRTELQQGPRLRQRLKTAARCRQIPTRISPPPARRRQRRCSPREPPTTAGRKSPFPCQSLIRRTGSCSRPPFRRRIPCLRSSPIAPRRRRSLRDAQGLSSPYGRRFRRRSNRRRPSPSFRRFP